jgi:hypothetical protein
LIDRDAVNVAGARTDSAPVPNATATMRQTAAKSRPDEHAAASAPSFPTLRERIGDGPRMERPRPASAAAVGPAKRRPVVSALSYGILGFVLGAIFWHFVGFWDFVGQVMFKGRAAGTEITQAPPPIKLKDKVSGASSLAIVPEPETCISLELDRQTATTSAGPCAAEALPLRSGLKTAKREDRWVTAEQRMYQATVRGWSSVTVEAGGPKKLDQASAD